MPKRSAGLLLYRLRGDAPELFLVHPGGPFWAKKDDGAWSIPKGLYDEGEEPLAAARREFAEETGFTVDGECLDLGEFKQPGRKIVRAFAIAGDADPAQMKSNSFTLEWPPKSGRTQDFPEADRAGWFTPVEARQKLVKGQIAIVDALLERLGSGVDSRK
jgi:predicted NUDIX family NTP pyrophosphohydrolase